MSSFEHKRGKIKDNALKALVTSPLFRTRVEKAKKGKGSYSRKAKHKNDVGFNMNSTSFSFYLDFF